MNQITSLQYYGLSDIGCSRIQNEDVWGALPEFGFFALADGMGGHKAGEVAAKETVDFLLQYIKKVTRQDILELMIEMRHGIELANQHIFRMGSQIQQYHKMGTTLCCLLWRAHTIIYAHVGDSRIYRFRDKKLELLTQDHSLFAEWMSKGKIAQECTTPYPYKHVITRSIGNAKKANPEIASTSYLPEDIFFLCSDGLTDMLSQEEMEKILNTHQTLETAANTLIETAKIKGGSDNMTVLMIRASTHGIHLS